jgi:hypothetical protein
MKLLKEKRNSLAKLLSKNSRYVDNMATLNYLYSHILIKDIYPPSLEMERSGDDNKAINYLDLNINIEEDGLHTIVYNKTDDLDLMWFHLHNILIATYQWM